MTNICSAFTEEQLIKIKHRRRYVRKQKVSDTCNTSKDDELDLLGDDVDAFSGSQADLEGAAENLFLSPPRPQPLCFESLSLRTPQTVPPTPGTALQHKIESKLDKSLGNQFNIQFQQQMGVFEESMLEAMKSPREEMQCMKKASEAEVEKTSALTLKGGLSKQSVELSYPNNQLNPRTSDHSDAQPMETDFWGPSLPPRFGQSVQSEQANMAPNHHSLDHHSEHSEQPERVCSSRAKKHLDKKKHKVRAKYFSQSSTSEEDQSSVPIKRSAKPQRAPSEQDQQQNNPDPVFYREVDMFDLPSQYAEEVEIFRHILDLPDPRETMPFNVSYLTQSLTWCRMLVYLRKYSFPWCFHSFQFF